MIENEAKRNEEMIRSYEALISKLPKGSLILRKSKYYYLKYRKDNKVCDEYVGMDGEKVECVRSLLERRKHYEAVLYKLLQERKVINKILEAVS